MSYNYGRSLSEMNSKAAVNTDIASQYGNAQLSWHAAQSSGLSPALDIYLQSNYDLYDDRNALDVDEKWSAHLGFKLYWAKRESL